MKLLIKLFFIATSAIIGFWESLLLDRIAPLSPALFWSISYASYALMIVIAYWVLKVIDRSLANEYDYQ